MDLCCRYYLDDSNGLQILPDWMPDPSYRKILTEQYDLLQHITQFELARYLGIETQSLSGSGKT